MSIETINDFRSKYQKFLKWLPYMREKFTKIAETKPDKWKKVFDEFSEKIVDPMDAAWNLLNEAEKEMF